MEEDIVANKDLYFSDEDLFYSKLIEKYNTLTEEGYGQCFGQPSLFTPYKEGSDDYQEFRETFENVDELELSPIMELTGESKPDFLFLIDSYGCPDSYFITLPDPKPDNPTVFRTDHETFLEEVDVEGSLEEFLDTFMTQEEFIEILKELMQRNVYFDSISQ